MSYSFSVRAGSKAAALVAAEAEFKRVVEQQPIHATEEKQARVVREQVLDAMPNDLPAGNVFSLSCNGSVSYIQGEAGVKVIGVSINAYASFVLSE